MATVDNGGVCSLGNCGDEVHIEGRDVYRDLFPCSCLYTNVRPRFSLVEYVVLFTATEEVSLSVVN